MNKPDNRERSRTIRDQSATSTTDSRWRPGAVLVVSVVVLTALVCLLVGPAAAADSHTNETSFTATNDGGGIAISSEDGNSFTFDEGDIVIEGQVTADGTWESTSVEIADQTIQGATVEVLTPNGLSGEFDRQRDIFTVEGRVVFSTLFGKIPFDVAASTENVDGDATLNGQTPTVTVVDDTFAVEATGTSQIDDQLGLPAELGENRFGLPLSLTIDSGTSESDDSDQSEDVDDSESQLPEDAEVELSTDSEGRRSVNATVPSARGGKPVEVPVSGDEDDDSVGAQSLSITPREDADITVDAMTSTDELNTTPTQCEGFSDNTTVLEYVSVGTNPADEDIEEFAVTTRVNTSQLRELGTDAEDISLYRFNESQQRWVDQNTTVVERSEQSVLLRGVADHPSEWTTAAARPEFEIAQTGVEMTAARVGDSVAVDVVVENTGGTEGNYRADLLLNSEVVDSQEAVIAEDGEALFDFQPAFEEAGTHEVQVNDVRIDEIEVTAEDSSSADGGGNGFGIVLAATAVLVTGLYARRRGHS